MNCRKVRQTVYLYVDNEMEGELLISFRRHLELCPGCAREIEYAVRLLGVVRRRCPRTVAPDSLRRRIQSCLRGIDRREGR